MARVVVGMSGGVDSSVAAAVLRDEGHEVIGATMLVWSPPGVDMNYSDSCCGLSAAEDARRVCARLGIRHYTLDFKEAFYEAIIRNYVEEYLAGHTPNPCVRCNEFIKFHALLERARHLGAEYVATGHYARTHQDEHGWHLLRGRDARKDQSYALYRLSQQQLAHTLFPLGEMTKSEVRARAVELDLPTAGKPDSQETCFVPNNDYPALLQILVPEAMRPGEFVNAGGEVVGRHAGLPHYTLGQRKRINIGSPVPLYVSHLDAARNTVTVVPGNHPSLYRRVVTAGEVNLIPPASSRLEGGIKGTARIRYNSVDQPALLRTRVGPGGLLLEAEFDQPVRAATPGQSLVCYEGERVVGGGIILPPAAGEG